jgi:uncharacterized protein (TIGR00369 family)
VSGDRSDFRDLLGVRIVERSDGRAVVELDTGSHHLNRHDTVHGGVLATLVDVAMGEAVASEGGGERGPVTVHMSLAYLEPAQPGRLSAVATVRKRGRRVTIVDAQVDQEGEAVLVAVGTFTTPS